MNSQRLEDLGAFYGALAEVEERIGGKRRLDECHGRLGWPKRGVYFFFEADQNRTSTGGGQRVVRVGTHALKTGSSSRLWGRLSQHRGAATGRGNHRGSIFRLLVGEALLARSGRHITSWGVGGTLREAADLLGRDLEELRAEEAHIESDVSVYIGAMPFVWIDVDDEPSPVSARGAIERNTIGLLSNHSQEPLDRPSSDWLGLWSGRANVRNSGMWNNNHVSDGYDRTFLRLFRAAKPASRSVGFSPQRS